MNTELVDKIARAVLYEGYMLYPYRASAVKNRQRWNFGAVYPEPFGAANRGTDACVMQTQCLLTGSDEATIDVNVKFLHLLAREVYERVEDGGWKIEDGGLRIEDGGLRIEDGGWKIEDGGLKIEDGGLRIEDGKSWLDDGSILDLPSSIFNPPSSLLHPPSSILHPQSSILNPPSSILNPPSSAFRLVASLEADGQLFQTWQEAVEREVRATGLGLGALSSGIARVPFSFAASNAAEPIGNASIAGAMVRRQESIEGAFEISAERLEERVFKITVRIVNTTAMNAEDCGDRDEALMRALVSTHTVVGVRGGELVSLLDPPKNLSDFAAGCTNIGTYPVLVGEPGERDLMLSSPIILYDYPQIAPESAGDLFDSTEIDEILTLRILTLTDEEKREMRSVDDRARRILERTESMPLEQLMKLHGAVRGLRPPGMPDKL